MEKEKQLPSLLSLKVDPPQELQDQNPNEVVLPQALEDVLALKNQRALELGDEETNVQIAPKKKTLERPTLSDDEDNPVIDNKDDKKLKTKNKRKKKKKKNRKVEDKSSEKTGT